MQDTAADNILQNTAVQYKVLQHTRTGGLKYHCRGRWCETQYMSDTIQMSLQTQGLSLPVDIPRDMLP